MSVIKAFRGSINGLLDSYPSRIEEDRQSLDDADHLGPIMIEALKLKVREKEMLLSSLQFLGEYEQDVLGGKVSFQLLMKMKEREESDRREEAHRRFVAEVRAKALERLPIAQVEVDMGADIPKANLTLFEGEDVKQTVTAFCRNRSIDLSNLPNLEKALRARVISPPPLQLVSSFPVAFYGRSPHSILFIDDGCCCTNW